MFSLLDLGDVSQIGQVGLLEIQATEVFQSLVHLFYFSSGKQGERVPVPLEVNDLTVQPDRKIGSHEMLGEECLAAWGNTDLLGSLGEVELRMRSVVTHHVHVPGFRGIDQEEPLLHLIHLFAHGYHLELAQVLDGLKLLHVQGTKAGVVEPLGHDPQGVTHENLIHPVARDQVSERELNVVLGVSG